MPGTISGTRDTATGVYIQGSGRSFQTRWGRPTLSKQANPYTREAQIVTRRVVRSQNCPLGLCRLSQLPSKARGSNPHWLYMQSQGIQPLWFAKPGSWGFVFPVQAPWCCSLSVWAAPSLWPIRSAQTLLLLSILVVALALPDFRFPSRLCTWMRVIATHKRGPARSRGPPPWPSPALLQGCQIKYRMSNWI